MPTQIVYQDPNLSTSYTRTLDDGLSSEAVDRQVLEVAKLAHRADINGNGVWAEGGDDQQLRERARAYSSVSRVPQEV